MNLSKNEVCVRWQTGQDGIWWNETCAIILEVFGLPGGRYISSPTADYMIFNFTNTKDADLCKILLSERL